jgi:hypothetical protein
MSVEFPDSGPLHARRQTFVFSQADGSMIEGATVRSSASPSRTGARQDESRLGPPRRCDEGRRLS